MYWSGSYVTTSNGSVRNYLDNQIWDFRIQGTDGGADVMLTELDSAGQTFDIFCSTTITAPRYSTSKPGLILSQANNATTLWNATQAGHLRIPDNNRSRNCCDCFGWGQLSPTDVFPSSSTGILQQIEYCLTGLIAAVDKSILVHAYFTTPGSSAYNNVPNLPDNTPATLGVLRNAGLLGQATVTVVQDPDASTSDSTEYISTQSQVNIPAQVEFEGRTTSGRGFTLTGCTQDQPTNTSAVCCAVDT